MNRLQRIADGERLPIKVVQFGEGNFLRAFVDFAFQRLNQDKGFHGGVAVVQPIEQGLIKMLNAQDGLYTLFLKGISEGRIIEEKELITNVVQGVDPYTDFEAFLALAREPELQFVISNTTEAGIAHRQEDTAEMRPPASFPAKLTLFLHERFRTFEGDPEKGLTLIPCELINYNADTLKDIILTYINDWELGTSFKDWVLTANTFHNTLVDRIVPGYPKDDLEVYTRELAYEDRLIVTAEAFFLWVIEGDAALKAKLPFEGTGLDVKIVSDMQPYRTRKVRILNGAHTAMVPLSLLYGLDTVREAVEEDFAGTFVQELIFEEVIQTLDMDRSELETFAKEVFDRFRNPFIKHRLASIALNSISKFKVRVLPSLLGYVEAKGVLPLRLTYAFACLIRFYKGDFKGNSMPVQDDADIVSFFAKQWALPVPDLVDTVLAQDTFWGQDLRTVPGLAEALETALVGIETEGIADGFVYFKKTQNNA